METRGEKVRTGKLRVGDVITSKKFEYVQVDSEGDISIVPKFYSDARRPAWKTAKFVVEEVRRIPWHSEQGGGAGWNAHKEFFARKLSREGRYDPKGKLI